MNPDPVAIGLIETMIENNLMLGWDHLQDGRCDLAIHEFNAAIEKVGEIKVLRGTAIAAEVTEKRANASHASTTEPTNVETNPGSPNAQ